MFGNVQLHRVDARITDSGMGSREVVNVLDSDSHIVPCLFIEYRKGLTLC